ncbi:hypothetical protein NM208_g5315 [Fusarium decemcellulare]|uniref:Uncharacterized protein n=1 Tax=Fusarium decemcellulare TaxID=57161 RepID=A0ACC1SHI2_9HYPO|nr:hypothetical protein NM208_g5315 [Fusarium decemcellulare]
MSSTGYNCLFDARGDEIEPYGDVGGPGVLAGFLGTAWIAVFFVILHYVVVFDPEQNPFEVTERAAVDEPARPWKANPIDLLAKNLIRKGTGRPKARTSVLSMCDVQIVTGLGILISGYSDLPKGISAYHFLLVTHVAWFSNLTHICGLTVLRRYLHSRPAEKWGRLFCMALLSAMLLGAMAPTLFFNWAHADEGTASLAGSDAICFYNRSRSTDWHKESHSDHTTSYPDRNASYAGRNISYPYQDAFDTDPRKALQESTAFQSGILSILLLVFSLASRMIKLQDTLTNGIRDGRKWCSDRFTNVVNRVYWLLISAIWGTIKLFLTKSTAEVDENDWTFGQILPAVLLLGPFVTAAEIVFDPEIKDWDSFSLETSDGGRHELEEHGQFTFDEPSAPGESLEMRRLRQQVANCLNRNYYDIETCAWILPAVSLACFQVVEVSILMFVDLAVERSSATQVLGSYAFLIFLSPYLLEMRSRRSLLVVLAGIAATTAIPVDAPPTIEPRQDADAAFDKIIRDVNVPKYVPPPLRRDITDWLAIGDSFSAGISADGPADEINWSCSRFKESYPNQMNEDPRFPGHSTSRTFVFGSCTGAKIDGILANQIELGKPSDATYPKIGDPQLGTVSLSGNDLGFGDIVNACLYHWTGYGDCGALLKNAHEALDDPARLFELKIFDTLTKILFRARSANPSFQLYVTGYIRFWNDQNPQCDEVSWAPWYKSPARLTSTLRQDMNDLVLKLNSKLKSAAEELYRYQKGIYFVDEFESKFDGHRFCEEEEDANYHNKPIGRRNLDPPPKDGKSTTDRIKEVNGDLAKLNPAYTNVDTMTETLKKLGEVNERLAMLPITWIRIMHPKGSGYKEISNAVIDKVLEFSATGGRDDQPEQGLKYDMNDKIGKFCSEAAKQRVQDKDSGSTMRKYNAGTRFEVDISMDWPSGLDISDNEENKCKEKMTLIIDSCDGNNPANPLNWKHGGTIGDGPVRYGIYPKIDQGYRPGSCSFHLRENVKWFGVDGPGTKRTWWFSVQQLRMVDGAKNEIGRARFKKNSGDGDPIECGDGDPFSWETKLPDRLDITPEARNDYVQFNIGGRSWTTHKKDGETSCSVGGYSGRYSPIVSHGASESIHEFP